MPLWNNTDDVASTPTFAVDATGLTSATAYANTSANPVLYAVDVAESQVARADGKGSVTPGWVTVKTVGSRTQYETLVALKIVGGDNTANTDLDDAEFPDT